MITTDKSTPPSLSIIIPVYNAEQTLERCVASIFRQGLLPYSFEVLLVNDGSTDNSLSVCKLLASAHNEIKVIDKPNGGVADARNRGLQEAAGQWVGFLDDDDYLLDNGYAIAFQPYCHREDIDVIRYFSSYDTTPVLPIETGIVSEGKVWDLLKAGKTFLPSFVWLQFYRRSYIIKHNIRFRNVAMFDDYVFASSVFLTNPYLLTVKANIIRYSVREGNGTSNRSIAYSRKVAHGAVEANKILCDTAIKFNVRQDETLWNALLASLNHGKRIGISRILSSRYSHKEYLVERNLWHKTGYYPVVIQKGIACTVMNWIMSYWIAYRFFSLLFNGIVEPYLMPILRKRLR